MVSGTGRVSSSLLVALSGCGGFLHAKVTGGPGWVGRPSRGESSPSLSLQRDVPQALRLQHFLDLGANGRPLFMQRTGVDLIAPAEFQQASPELIRRFQAGENSPEASFAGRPRQPDASAGSTQALQEIKSRKLAHDFGQIGGWDPKPGSKFPDTPASALGFERKKKQSFYRQARRFSVEHHQLETQLRD